MRDEFLTICILLFNTKKKNYYNGSQEIMTDEQKNDECLKNNPYKSVKRYKILHSDLHLNILDFKKIYIYFKY